jgi:small subunit ribosomal protein S14
MAKTSLRVKQSRKPKYPTRGYSRCRRCGRWRGVYRLWGVGRMGGGEPAHVGHIPGMTKSSW